jgi:hypothetical protein
MMATETLNIVITTKAKGDGAKKAEKGLQGLVKAAKAFAGIAAVGAVAKQAVELGKLGIASQTAAVRFERFAGSAERADMLLAAFNDGAQGTVDQMTAMAASGRLLQMGLVETGDEMEQVAAMATRLGDQTIGAQARLEAFAAMLANQSIPRLDNFGISSGRVRARIDELLKSGQALSREQAFKMAVMEEGAKALDRLGDTSDLTSVRVEKITAAWKTLKQEMGVIMIEDATNALNALSTESRSAEEGLREFPKRFREWREQIQKTTFAHRASTEEIRESREEHQKFKQAQESSRETSRAMAIDLVTGTESQAQYTRGIQESMDAMDQAAMSSADYRDKQQLLAITTGGAGVEAFDQYQAALDETEQALDGAERAIREVRIAEELALQATQRHTEYLFDASMSFTDFYRRQEETAEDYSQRLEDVEAKHQEKLADIAEKGRSRRVAVDEEGQALEIRIAQGRLDQLLEKRAEFNEETTDLERARSEKAIRSLEAEIAERTGLLERAADGYVAIAGRNVDELIGEEKRRYEEELRLLEENRAEQEAEQQRSLGQMILNQFNAYAEMALAADGWTDEEIKYVQEMQASIADEYGLITETAAIETARQAQYWADTMSIMRGDATGFFDAFQQRFNELPTEHVIRIRTELSGRPADIPDKPSGNGVPKPKVVVPPKPKRDDENIPEGMMSSLLTPRSIPVGPAPGGGVPAGISIGPVYVTTDDPAVLWKKLEQYARLKGKSGWKQLGR